jgi:hypothetical protein
MKRGTTSWTCAALAGLLASTPFAVLAEETAAGLEPARGSVGPALEADLLMPFLGITYAKVLVPVVRARERTFRGELMLGPYTDFAWGPISRPADQYGKVWLLGVRPGYRQYLAYGFFVDTSLVVGWRHEEQDLHGGGTLNGFYGRLWADAGWQVDVTARTFVNARGGVGLILWRTDAYGSTEKRWEPELDVDVGLRF